jgi:hypothetical protein
MYGNQENRSPAYGVNTPNPDSIPYSTTDPYAVNPYLNMNIKQQYSIPGAIGIGPWSQGSSMAGQDIWKPQSYVTELDAMRRAQAMRNVQGLYDPAPATADTSPSSLSTPIVHGNTADWQRSDVDATPYSGQYSPAKSIGEGIVQNTSWDNRRNKQRGSKVFSEYDQARFANNPTQYGHRLASTSGMNQRFLPSIGNYTAMGDIYGVSALGKNNEHDNRRGYDPSYKRGTIVGTPGGLFDYWNMIR